MSDVYLIHGWTYSLDKYQKLVDALSVQGIKVNVLKVPGLTKPSQKAWTMDDYVSWLEGKLSGSAKPVIIAHSNGGRIAMSYLQKYPSKFSKLILIDSAGVVHDDPLTKAKLATLKYLAKVGKLFTFIPGLKKIYYKLIGASDYVSAPPNMKQTLQNMLAANKDIDLSKIKVPTTIIWGRDDSATPLSDGQKLQGGIAGSTLDIIDGARHAPHFTHTDKVANIITKAIKN